MQMPAAVQVYQISTLKELTGTNMIVLTILDFFLKNSLLVLFLFYTFLHRLSFYIFLHLTAIYNTL